MAAPLPPPSMDSVALMLALLAAPLRLPLVLKPPAPAVPSLPLGSVRDERALVTLSNSTLNVGCKELRS